MSLSGVPLAGCAGDAAPVVMSHAQSHGATNGASLEDCHANFFALVGKRTSLTWAPPQGLFFNPFSPFQTDVCGIKWVVFREDESRLCPPPGPEPSSSSPAGEAASSRKPVSAADDPVLSSFRRCLESELLAVWRRVPKGALVTYTYDMSGTQVRQ